MHATQTPSSAGTVAEQINWELLREILACPACGAAPLARSAAHVSCAACSRTYPIEDGVINFLGRTEEVVPRFYRNPSYRQFMTSTGTSQAYARPFVRGSPEEPVYSTSRVSARAFHGFCI